MECERDKDRIDTFQRPELSFVAHGMLLFVFLAAERNGPAIIGLFSHPPLTLTGTMASVADVCCLDFDVVAAAEARQRSDELQVLVAFDARLFFQG